MTEAGRLENPVRTRTRILAARRKAESLGLPFTADMTAEQAVEGARAVDAVGRAGTFRGRDVGLAARRLIVFVADSDEGEKA